MNHIYRPIGTRKPCSIEIVWDTIQSKSAKNWDDELTQSARLCDPRLRGPRLRDPRLVLYKVVTYTFSYLVLISHKAATMITDL